MVLEIKNLTKKFGHQIALDAVNLEVRDHEIIGLLGANGAGKSTLMKSISGILSIDKGSIFFNGKNIQDHELQAKSQIGFLAEDNPLYKDLYVKEYLRFVADLRKIPYGKVSEIIEMVGISPEKNKKIHQLSKGYKQRVGLAQAILHEPNLLILDEPTNGLDPNQILEIRQIIKNIGRAKTVILSTHIMQEVEALCTRVVLINKGKIIQDLPIEEFKGKYQSLEEAFRGYLVETVE